ncbi:hypothetical protein ACFYXS_07180 [Streptomyces sp. NPDC002574]|uniref:hypothetical protein n=1 Tax=Streptomyces sp. NPDC002574 TaxID=3364652 RepID=UPI0036B87D84
MHHPRVDDPARPAVVRPAGYGVTGRAARCARDDRVGYGIFELGSIGRHTPSGSTGKEAL